MLRTDNGGEYVSNEFSKYCASKGIIHQHTNPYNPDQNGVSERLNRTLVESAKSMMFHANVPINFWAEAVNTAVHLQNRNPTESLNMKTPYEYWFGKKPELSNLKVSDWSVKSIHLAIYDRSLLLDREKQCLLAIHQIQKVINCIITNRRTLCEANM